MNIFITNLSFHASMDIIKLIKKSKYRDSIIIGSSRYPFGTTSASLYVDKFVNQPSLNSEDKYLEFIIEVCKQYQIDILFAIDEDEIKILSRYKSLIPATLIIPENAIIELFCHKDMANNAIRKLGINIPKYIENISETNNIKSGQLISRKCISCASLGIKKYDISEITNLKNIKRDDSILQELIVGTEFCVDIFNDEYGHPKLIVPRKRIAIRGGTTHKCTIERNEKLISLSKKICSAFCLPGLINIQFICEKNTDLIYFLEVNPRIGATTIATSLASINLIELFIEHFHFKKELESFDFYMNKVKWNSYISRYYEETICFNYDEK